MATYFPTSNNQSDAATMLYPRDPLPGSYSETPVIPGNTMMYMNFSPSLGSFSNALTTGNSQRQSTCFEIQPAGNSEPGGSSQQEIMLNFGGSRIVEHDLSSWKDGRNEMLMMHSVNGAPSFLQGQGLSLSLGTHIPSGMQILPIPYQNNNSNFSPCLGPISSISNDERGGKESFEEDDNSQTRQLSYNKYMLSCIQGTNADAIKTDSYGMSSITRAVPSSKYLKAAQELLDEVVNVKKAIKEQSSKKELIKDSKEVVGGSGDGVSDPSQAGVSSVPPESSSNSTSELPAAEKQDLQNKLTKLLAMLDEVDRRYKQYYHQMKIVVSSFDVIAGSGAAKPYTALALLTISRHFRCLRDAINGQIQLARKNLGEQDDSSKGIIISRLRYVDKQLRQQRALQQLGMMPQHVWRPQRGLPETSVSILRAWLFEHFLHPYPKDSDKIMLARQTGLTRSQVSNWFINARVRLWKPMVEEMYKEETGDTEIDSNSSSETTPRTAKTDARTSQDKGEYFHQTSTSSGQLLASNSIPTPDIEMMEPDNNPTFQPHNKYGARQSRDGLGQIDDYETTLFQDSMVHSNYGTDRFLEAAYNISELERLGSGSGKISLTLGLQQSAGGNVPICNETRNTFVNIRGADALYASDLAMETETTGFDCMDSENQQQRFVPTRLL